jgi:hypothetical protein
MKLAEIEIYWSFAIHSALTLSLESALPENYPAAGGWYVMDHYVDIKSAYDWLWREDKPTNANSRSCRCLAYPRFRARDYKE